MNKWSIRGTSFRSIIFSTAGVMLIVKMLVASFCYAEGFSLEYLRDETITISVPSAWQIEEIGSIDEDAVLMDHGEAVYKVAELYDEDGSKQAELWIYADPEDDSYYYCNSESAAKEYYDNSGSYALESIIEEMAPEESWALGSPEYIEAEEDYDTTMILQTVAFNDKEYWVYLGCEFTLNGGIHGALFFDGATNRDLFVTIADSMDIFAYANELVGDQENDAVYDSEGPSLNNRVNIILVVALLLLLWWLFIGKNLKNIAVIALYFVNKMRNGEGRKSKVKSFAPETPPSVVNDLSKEKQTDTWVRNESHKVKLSPQLKHTLNKVQIHEAAKYSGYYESLKTLHKSGILTTKEMDELLAKHADYINNKEVL